MNPIESQRSGGSRSSAELRLSPVFQAPNSQARVQGNEPRVVNKHPWLKALLASWRFASFLVAPSFDPLGGSPRLPKTSKDRLLPASLPWAP